MKNFKKSTKVETIIREQEAREKFVDDVDFLKEVRKIAQEETLVFDHFCEHVGPDLFPIIMMIRKYSANTLSTIEIIDILLKHADEMKRLINRVKADPTKPITREEVLINLMGIDPKQVKEFLEKWDEKAKIARIKEDEAMRSAMDALVKAITSLFRPAEIISESFLYDRAKQILNDEINKHNEKYSKDDDDDTGGKDNYDEKD